MPVPRVSQTDLLADPESVLSAAERQAAIITRDGRDHVALVPLPDYVRLTGRTLDGKGVDPHLADLIAHFHQEEPIRFTSVMTLDLEPELIAFIKAEAESFGCSTDVVVNAILQAFIDEQKSSDFSETINLHVSEGEEQTLSVAARLLGKTLNDFIVDSAVAKANTILGSPDPSLDGVSVHGIADAEES